MFQLILKAYQEVALMSALGQRKKNKMPRERKRRLDELGFVWLGRVPMETMRRLRPERPPSPAGGKATNKLL